MLRTHDTGSLSGAATDRKTWKAPFALDAKRTVTSPSAVNDSKTLLGFVNPYWNFLGISQHSLALGRGVSLAHIADVLPDHVRMHIDLSESWLASRAVYALVLDWSADRIAASDDDQFSPGPNNAERRALRMLERTTEAVWITKRSTFSFDFIVDFSRDGPPASSISWGRVPSLVSLPSYANEILGSADLEQASEVNDAIAQVLPRTALNIALDALWHALTETNPFLRYLLLWVALEALFGPESSQELSYRLALRLTRFGEHQGEKLQSRFSEIRMAYDLRSKIVHGRTKGALGKDDSDRWVLFCEGLLQSALRRILTDPNLRAVFCSAKEREGYLDAIALGCAFL